MASKVERVAKLAMELGERHLAAYGAERSWHDFTQKQLMACLVLRAYLKTTYRGVVDLLSGHQKLREPLGMEDKVPHYTTLQKCSNVLDIVKKGGSQQRAVAQMPAWEKSDNFEGSKQLHRK